MLGKILGGYVGQRVGNRYNREGGGSGLRGALIGTGIAMVARRGLGPLGLLLGGGYVAKKVLDRRRDRRDRY
ncbi:MAG TPA: hypothetical protein VF655_08440 [Allosphingosinicella sp.]|jgi:hypothetical protein